MINETNTTQILSDCINKLVNSGSLYETGMELMLRMKTFFIVMFAVLLAYMLYVNIGLLSRGVAKGGNKYKKSRRNYYTFVLMPTIIIILLCVILVFVAPYILPKLLS